MPYTTFLIVYIWFLGPGIHAGNVLGSYPFPIWPLIVDTINIFVVYILSYGRKVVGLCNAP